MVVNIFGRNVTWYITSKACQDIIEESHDDFRVKSVEASKYEKQILRNL